MLREFLHRLRQWLLEASCTWWKQRLPAPEMFVPAGLPSSYRPMRRVLLTDEIGRTLFEEYQAHRQGTRGGEEIGWVLLGERREDEVLVLATLPAGTARSASNVHVRFDSDAQALGSRVVRHKGKRLTIVGVVHTHPGSLRHPSEGDYQGDRTWVGQLRGGEGVFGIGTADGPHVDGSAVHMQIQGELCFSWYALGQDDRRYRRLPVETTPGPDLARPLHAVWPTIEMHALPLDRLYRQLAGMTLESADSAAGPVLALKVKLAEPGASLHVLLDRGKVQYYLDREGQSFAIDPKEESLERALYMILAELAAGPIMKNEAKGRKTDSS
jgi:proteasome lid subunit RPN8/RPN11